MPDPARRLHHSSWDSKTLLKRQRAHGYTREDVRIVIRPMAINGEEALGSMGNDAPLAVLSDKSQLLFNYFKQTFAQVTNPPIDPLREELVMSLRVLLGGEQNLFDETPEHCHRLALSKPLLTNEQLQSIKDLDFRDLRTKVLPTFFEIEHGADAGNRKALDRSASRPSVRSGRAVSGRWCLSDRGHDAVNAPIPSLLAVAAVHHHLIRKGKRSLCGLVVETGEAREVMHFCLLLGYGVSAINPYLAYETLYDQVQAGNMQKIDGVKSVENYVKAAHKGIRKVMSKMGISTLQSYQGAQIFEAIGLRKSLIQSYFTGTYSRIEGAGLEEIAAEVAVRHHVRATRCRALFDPGARTGRHLSMAAAVVTTCTTRSRSRCYSTPCAPRTTSCSRQYSSKMQRQQQTALHDPRHAGRSSRRSRSRSKRSSLRPRSSSASRPARCRSARSPKKRTRTSRSR